MSLWLDAARLAAGVNLLLAAGLGAIWLRNYRRHGASHTLALVVVAGFFVAENALWLFLYALHSDFYGWFLASGTDIQAGVTMLCGLELVALLALARITWW